MRSKILKYFTLDTYIFEQLYFNDFLKLISEQF